MCPIFRFAPSPNGYLHLGHAYSALLNAKFAHQNDGKLLLRIEDVDLTRARPHFEQAIYQDLAFLGIKYEPEVRIQSQHFDFYEKGLARLQALGVLYKSYETRQEPISSLTQKEIERREKSQMPHAFRLNLNAINPQILHEISWSEMDFYGQISEIKADLSPFNHVILARKDIKTSYHLSVVMDDAHQKITHVVRGQDLYQQTGLHRLLQILLDLPAPIYHHHPLILDESAHKLSKSKGSKSLRDYINEGLTQEQLKALVAAKANQSL